MTAPRPPTPASLRLAERASWGKPAAAPPTARLTKFTPVPGEGPTRVTGFLPPPEMLERLRRVQ